MGFLFGQDYQDPSESAMPYLNQIPGTVSPYYQPFIDYGLQAGGIMAQQYGQMATDPSGYYDDIMGGYSQSPGSQYQQQQMQQQMSGNAAAGGFTGTEYDQQRQAEALQGILGQDQQRYYQDVTGSQQTGLGGEQHMFDTGYNASSSLANSLGSNLAAQAGLEYQSTAGQNAYNQAHHNALFSLIGAGAGAAGGSMYGRSMRGQPQQPNTSPYGPYSGGYRYP